MQNDMDDISAELGRAVGAPLPRARLSRWEWLPPVAVALLASVYFLAEPGSSLNRFALFVGFGLVPGSVWRLAGRGSWNIHRICFAAALIMFVVENPKLRPDAESWGRIGRNWRIVLLGFVFSFTQPLWGMLRTHRLLTDGGMRISVFNSLKLCLSGSFFNIFLPGSAGGDAYRIYAITDGYRQRVATAIASISLDRLLGLPSLIAVLLLGMALDYDFFLGNRTLSRFVPFLAAAGGMCLVMLLYLMYAGRSGRRIARMEGDGEFLPPARPPGRLRRAHLRISANIKRPATLPLALFFGLLSHLGCIAACQCFGAALGVEGVPFRRYYLIVPLAMTINAIPGAPGGVGQGELAMATLLNIANPGAGNAQLGVVVMLLFRLSNMTMGVLGGLFYAMGKTELIGMSHVSQGVTRIIRRNFSDTVRMLRSARPPRMDSRPPHRRMTEYLKPRSPDSEDLD